ncbi:hypothetical protein E8E13_010280 [Curvularia kusanoi]|uniref:Uncharacterized protein n=1 Tax=Curvularia kusanoi TaxID=90978 RepID=A0A9P4TJB2_CURKU|nr:hypothetical protein E8E13_010280 [Curvularia kusanoi]
MDDDFYDICSSKMGSLPFDGSYVNHRHTALLVDIIRSTASAGQTTTINDESNPASTSRRSPSTALQQRQAQVLNTRKLLFTSSLRSPTSMGIHAFAARPSNTYMSTTFLRTGMMLLLLPSSSCLSLAYGSLSGTMLSNCSLSVEVFKVNEKTKKAPAKNTVKKRKLAADEVMMKTWAARQIPSTAVVLLPLIGVRHYQDHTSTELQVATTSRPLREVVAEVPIHVGYGHDLQAPPYGPMNPVFTADPDAYNPQGHQQVPAETFGLPLAFPHDATLRALREGTSAGADIDHEIFTVQHQMKLYQCFDRSPIVKRKVMEEHPELAKYLADNPATAAVITKNTSKKHKRAADEAQADADAELDPPKPRTFSPSMKSVVRGSLVEGMRWVSEEWWGIFLDEVNHNVGCIGKDEYGEIL